MSEPFFHNANTLHAEYKWRFYHLDSSKRIGGTLGNSVLQKRRTLIKRRKDFSVTLSQLIFLSLFVRKYWQLVLGVRWGQGCRRSHFLVGSKKSFYLQNVNCLKRNFPTPFFSQYEIIIFIISLIATLIRFLQLSVISQWTMLILKFTKCRCQMEG